MQPQLGGVLDAADDRRRWDHAELDEVEGAHTWDVMGRGLDARVVTDLGMPWGESTTCTGCGKCVQVCPTGAIFEKGRPIATTKVKRPYLPYLKAHSQEVPA